MTAMTSINIHKRWRSGTRRFEHNRFKKRREQQKHASGLEVSALIEYTKRPTFNPNRNC